MLGNIKGPLKLTGHKFKMKTLVTLPVVCVSLDKSEILRGGSFYLPNANLFFYFFIIELVIVFKILRV